MAKTIDFSVSGAQGTVCHHPIHKLGLYTPEGTILTNPQIVEGLIREGYKPGDKVSFDFRYTIQPKE